VLRFKTTERLEHEKDGQIDSLAATFALCTYITTVRFISHELELCRGLGNNTEKIMWHIKCTVAL